MDGGCLQSHSRYLILRVTDTCRRAQRSFSVMSPKVMKCGVPNLSGSRVDVIDLTNGATVATLNQNTESVIFRGNGSDGFQFLANRDVQRAAGSIVGGNDESVLGRFDVALSDDANALPRWEFPSPGPAVGVRRAQRRLGPSPAFPRRVSEPGLAGERSHRAWPCAFPLPVVAVEQTKQHVEGLRRAAAEHGRPAELGDLEVTVTPVGGFDRRNIEVYAAAGVHRL